MDKKQRDILERAYKSNEGLIKPATMINVYAEGDHALVERLVSQGYLERVYQFKSDNIISTYSIIYYAVTEKGAMCFASMSKQAWFGFKSNVSLWIGIGSMIVSIYALAANIHFASTQNERENADSVLRNRPYLIATDLQIRRPDSEGGIDFNIAIKNVGILPAHVLDTSVVCPEGQRSEPLDQPVIGNGEQMFYKFTVKTLNDTVSCNFRLNYTIAGSADVKNFATEYILILEEDGSLTFKDPVIQ